jgi:hypothetical protein
MIVLFTRKDDLDDDDQSLDKYMSSSPPQLRDFVRQCNDRCIGFNNRGSKSEKENQVKQLFKMIDTMVLNNGGKFYTNEMFEEAEKTLKRRPGDVIPIHFTISLVTTSLVIPVSNKPGVSTTNNERPNLCSCCFSHLLVIEVP